MAIEKRKALESKQQIELDTDHKAIDPQNTKTGHIGGGSRLLVLELIHGSRTGARTRSGVAPVRYQHRQRKAQRVLRQ